MLQHGVQSELCSDDPSHTCAFHFEAFTPIRKATGRGILLRGAREVASLAREEGDSFAVVRAAHPAGADSVIAVLQKNGLKVERIQDPRGGCFTQVGAGCSCANSSAERETARTTEVRR